MVQGEINDAAQTVARLNELTDLDSDPLVAITVHVDSVLWAAHSGAVEEGVRRTDLALELLRQLDPDESGQVTLPPWNQSMAVTTYANGAWANALANKTGGAIEMLARARKIATRLADPFSIGLVAAQGIVVAHMLGDWVLLTELIDWARRSVTSEFVLYDAWLSAGATVADAVGGDNQAVAGMEAAVRRLKTLGVASGQTQWHEMLAEAYLARGRIDQAIEAALEGLEWSRRHGERYWAPELERQAGLALAARGDQAGSTEAFARAHSTADEIGNLLVMSRLATPDNPSRGQPSTV